MHRIVSVRDLEETEGEGGFGKWPIERSSPEVLPDRIRNARKQDASRIDNPETPNRRDISRDDVLRVDAGVQQPLR